MIRSISGANRRRFFTVVLVTLVVAIAPYLMWQRAEGGPTSAVAPDGIVVIGDSITALYNDEPGDDRQGWWSIVARHYNADVDTYAQSGSGFLRTGARCEGNRFGDRLEAFDETASIVLIEGGRNDWSHCVGGRPQRASNLMIRNAVKEYFDTVKEMAALSTRVMVMSPPWGPHQPLEGLRVSQIVRTEAEAHGFEFIDTSGILGRRHVTDGIHPNRAGSLAIADRVIAAIG